MKLFINIAFLLFICCNISCNYMREVSVYEPSKEISPIDKFTYKTLFTSSDESGLWGVKNNACKQVYFDTVNSYTGKDHLHIKC